MSRIARLLRQAAAWVNAPIDIADAFSTDLYTGNSSSQTITNGIDLAGEGGLVWIKNRNNTESHILTDTVRGATNTLNTNQRFQEYSYTNMLMSFLSDGFTVGNAGGTGFSGYTYTSWTFRKAPKFFDVVTYTGDGTAGRTISHDLGIEPGMVVVKKRSASAPWYVYHSSLGATEVLILNTTNATQSVVSAWNNTEPTDEQFTLGSSNDVNGSGQTYIAYLFAHDPGSNGIIQCGSYTGNGSSTGPTITLGWEPQYVMIKNTTTLNNWAVYDSARDTSNPRTAVLYPNGSFAETTTNYDIDFQSSGFQLKFNSGLVNASGDNYVFMAIRAEGV